MNRDKKRPTPDRDLDAVAIVGMACLFPGAPDVETYWRNIVEKFDAIVDPPSGSWDSDVLYDPDARGGDRVYCRKGGYLGRLAKFDPLEHGVLPLAVQGGEPEQWLALQVAKRAMEDAGFADGVPSPETTAVILGKGDYLNRGNLSVLQHAGFVDQTLEIVATLHPELERDDLVELRSELTRALPPFNADTVPALVPNIAAGRIANKLDLMGPSYTVDAACASSLIATDHALRELASGRSDLALVGGLHIVLPMQIRQVFCQLEALSRLQSIRPFDGSADGTILGEGIGMMVLERLEDAERAGRRIYAVIRGVGTASDGRGLSVMAPRLDGEILALRRAYESTGVDPASIGLVEAHGTGTPVGDATEVAALGRIFGARSRRFPHVALGSVKSMIGHLMPAAGMAAMIKSALALHHKTLPPTLGVETPREELRADDARFYLNRGPRPWIVADGGPRRAGVNAFGFGGINAHAILEEHVPQPDAPVPPNTMPRPCELVVLRGATRVELLAAVRSALDLIELHAGARLLDIAHTLNASQGDGGSVLSVVASSAEQLRTKLEKGLAKLEDSATKQIKNVRGGVYFFEEKLGGPGRVAFMFPGEGSQYEGMLRETVAHFPEAREAFEIPERSFARRGESVLPSEAFFAPEGCDEEQRSFVDEWIWSMRGAVTGVLTADWAALAVLRRLGVKPDAVVGHSTGEYPALAASGMIDVSRTEDADRFTLELNALYEDLEKSDVEMPPAALAAIGAISESVDDAVASIGEGIRVAMDNCPHQSVICGPPDAIDAALEKLQRRGMICERLAFARPYHTPDFEPFAEALTGFFDRWLNSAPTVKTYTCATAEPFPDDVGASREIAVQQWMRKVAFRETIERMHDDGIRLFVEVGARGNLSAFVDDILRGRAHATAPFDLENRSGFAQVCHVAGMLSAHGVTLDLGALTRDAGAVELDVASRPESSDDRAETLETGWPVMRVSEETAQKLRDRAGMAAAPAASFDPVDRGGASKGPDAGDGAPREEPQPRATPVSAHFATMERFLSLNKDVMQRYLTGRGGSAPTVAAGPVSGAVAVAPRPLAGTVVEHRPGEFLRAERRLHPAEEPFLCHHTFGRRLSVTDRSLLGMPVVPFTFTIEMMAEHASLLAGDLPLKAMRDVRGFRWVTTGDGALDVVIQASVESRSAGETAVRVQVHDAREVSTGGDGPAVALAEGTAVFGEIAPAPVAATGFELLNPRPSTWPPERLYEDVMFHETAMQGVASMDRVGDDGAVATLDVLPRDPLFRGGSAAGLLTDPCLLDQAGQVVGFWAKELWRSDVFFPFYVEEIALHEPLMPEGEKVECRARLAIEEGEQISGQLDVVRPDGSVAIRVTGWRDRRFAMTEELCSFFLNPPEKTLSGVDAAAGGGDVVVREVSLDRFPKTFFVGAGGMWRRSLALAILGRREREAWSALELLPLEESRWLLRRLVVKEAVRDWVNRTTGGTLCPADVEVELAGDGTVRLLGNAIDRLPSRPEVRLTKETQDAWIAECRRAV